MKKKRIVAITVILILVGILLSYKAIGTILLNQKTQDYLVGKGYSQSDISDIEIKYSFLNKLLSYNEWRIFVEFECEPEITFAFTYRNNEIIRQGITGERQLDKDEILEYGLRFENGELIAQ